MKFRSVFVLIFLIVIVAQIDNSHQRNTKHRAFRRLINKLYVRNGKVDRFATSCKFYDCNMTKNRYDIACDTYGRYETMCFMCRSIFKSCKKGKKLMT